MVYEYDGTFFGFLSALFDGYYDGAQRFGAKDEKGLKKYVGNAGIVSVIIAIIMTALTVLLCGDRKSTRLNSSH